MKLRINIIVIFLIGIAIWKPASAQDSSYTFTLPEALRFSLSNSILIDHPRMKNYKNEHTIKWSKTIDSADAFVVVIPEYNFSFPAALKNALDYLFVEWSEKPMAFVSYGGISAGTRSVQDIKGPVTTFGMMPIPQAVNIPFFSQLINSEGVFEGNEKLEKSAEGMLAKLAKWAGALKAMREGVEA